MKTVAAHAAPAGNGWQRLRGRRREQRQLAPQPRRQQLQRQQQHHHHHYHLITAVAAAPEGAGGNEAPSSAPPAAVPAPPAPPAEGLLSAQQQAAGFGLLAATSLALGAVALGAPQLLLSVALGDSLLSPGSLALEVAFTRIAGATMLVSAAVEASLQDAVLAGHLKSATYQRLLVAVLAKNVLYLLAFAMSPQLWTPVLAGLYPTAAAGSIVVAASTLRSALRQSGAASLPQGLAALGGGLGTLPKTPAAWGYALALVLYLATVAACYAPEAIFTGEPMSAAGLLLKHTWAPGFLLGAGACWVLGDAAERGRLGASTFRRLNAGLASLEGAYAAVFGAALASGLAGADAAAASNLAGSLVLAAFCGWQAATAKKQ